jgi:hypothetical protein
VKTGEDGCRRVRREDGKTEDGKTGRREDGEDEEDGEDGEEAVRI